MKRYTIKPDYADWWGDEFTETTVLTEEQVKDIARGWEMPLEEMLEGLEEIDGIPTPRNNYTYGEWRRLSYYMHEGVLAFWEEGYDYGDPDFWSHYPDAAPNFIEAVQMFDWLYKHDVIDNCGDRKEG